MLNGRRPLNPFTPSKEPDWVVIPKVSESQALPERTNSSASLQARQAEGLCGLPPPFNPTLNAPMPVGRDQTNVQSSGASRRSRTSSQESAVSASSAVSRKPAPPVPRKPVLLSRPSDQKAGHGKNTNEEEQDTVKSSMSIAIQSSSTTDPTVPPLPRRMPGQRPSLRDQESPQSPSLEADGPPLPPRRTVGSQSIMGLMDDDIKGASGIPSLQPQRQG